MIRSSNDDGRRGAAAFWIQGLSGPLEAGNWVRIIPAPSRDPTLPSSRGLGHSPLKAGTRVRIPLGAPLCKRALAFGSWARHPGGPQARMAVLLPASDRHE